MLHRLNERICVLVVAGAGGCWLNSSARIVPSLPTKGGSDNRLYKSFVRHTHIHARLRTGNMAAATMAALTSEKMLSMQFDISTF